MEATTLSASQFTSEHPLVWFLRVNHDRLLDLYGRYMQLQYDAYDHETVPMLKEIRVVRSGRGDRGAGS
jgi:hypothetical protein